MRMVIYQGFGKDPVALQAAEGCPASIIKELSETHEEAGGRKCCTAWLGEIFWLI